MTNLNLLLLFIVIPVTCFFAFKWKSRWMLAILSTTLGILLLELGSLAYNKLDKTFSYTYETSSNYRIADPELKYWFKPLSQSNESKLYKDGEVVYKNVTYNFDKIGRRASFPVPLNAEQHAFFFGGSFTFGMGVEDHQTIASVFAKCTNNKYQSFNYGGGGFGTGAMKIQLDRKEWFSDIPQSQGIAIYCFLPRHITRTTGFDLFDFNRAFRNNPIFRREKDGTVEGPIRCTDYPKLSKALARYQWLTRQSAFLELLFRVLKPKFGSEEEATRIVVDLIIQSSERYKKMFDGTFYVLIWPRVDSEMHSSNLALLESLLATSGIQVLKPKTLQNQIEAQIHLRDSHPSWKEYEYVGKQLCELISSNKDKKK